MLRLVFSLALILTGSLAGGVHALEVGITPELQTVITQHQGRPFAIQRSQNRSARIHPFYSYTSRKCPPFCLTPMVAAPGVETYGELEVLDALSRIGKGDETVMVVDTRAEKWPMRNMIPGAVNIPWAMYRDASQPEALERVLVPALGVEIRDGTPDFSNAKTLVVYCNGAWCTQSTHMVQDLLELGYPEEKLKWYRGGMQAWQLYGLTTVNCRDLYRDGVPYCD